MTSEHALPPSSDKPPSPELARLWSEVLGKEADPEQSFLANGGDSFRAVLLSAELFELTGQEIDYLDILGTEGLGALQGLLKA